MSAPAEPLVVACAADRAYALPLAVMLRSVDAHLDPSVALEFHVVDDGLEAGDRERIASRLSPRVLLHWRAPVPPGVAGLPTWGRMPVTTYQKLTIDRWLPDAVGRAIWLDCDLVVLADLAPLWRSETGEAIVLAARDPLVPTVASRFGLPRWRELGLRRDSPYFNAGVLLLDLERWRRAGIAERAGEYLERHRREIVFWDQEALNAALAGRWGELDPYWNWNPILTPLRLAGRRTEVPGIAHWSGRLKPWAYGGLGPLQDAWFRELDATAWVGFRPPAGARRAAFVRYARSRVRRRLLPLEQWVTALQRALTRRDVPG